MQLDTRVFFMTVYTTVRRLFCVYSEECLFIRKL